MWWWLRAILDYVDITADGGDILADTVVRMWPLEGQQECQPLHQVVAEALAVHVRGLTFRERGAGPRIDEHMVDAGFTVQVGVDAETGFVFGGNQWNCGTWMDKMGSSGQAGNKGVPSTPRDGSAVELVGLSYSCLRDLASLGPSVFPHQEVEGGLLSLTHWADTIQANFERHFWVGSKQGAEVEPQPHLVNRTQMYKDSVGSSGAFPDYQLRPNYLVTLCVAPGLVPAPHAWAALTTAHSLLLGPLGLATLDPQDWAYRGDYDNGNCSGDPTVAAGANYHQGPEWLWPVGFYLRALLSVSKLVGQKEEALDRVRQVLARHYTHLSQSAWYGLPELTNSGGAHCRDSNPVQCWSMATLLDALWDLQHL